MIILRILASLLFVHLCSSATAQVDPSSEWSTLTDTHAIWIYDSRHKELAYQYAKNFRRLFPQLKALFHEFPNKTTFVIVDQTDMPNGSATVFPYPLVTLFPVIPVPNSPIGETDDSLFEILAHEYTHILNLNPVHGVMKPLSWIFGAIIRPNSYLPRWYAEGLAVYTESYFMQNGGRLRSQNFEGMVRAISLEKDWKNYSIDELNDFEPDWLGGRRAYLLGGVIFYELIESSSVENIFKLNDNYSRRVPYFINGPLEDKIKKSYSELLKKSYEHLSQLVEKQLLPVKASPLSAGTALPQQGFENFYPSFSPNSQYLAYISRDHNVPSSVMLQKTTDGAKAERVAFGLDILHLAWSADSKTMAYNTIQRYKRFYTYSDIFLYNVETKKTTRLTFGARTGSMVFSSDNKKIFFVQNTPGSKRIAEVDLATKKVRAIYDPKKIGTNIFALTNQNNDVLFLEQFSEKRELKQLNTTSFSTTTVSDGSHISRIQRTTKGLLITSAKSGIDNLYLLTPPYNNFDFNAAKTMTNSLTRVFDGDLHPTTGTLVYAEQTAQGLHLKQLSEKDWRALTKTPSVEPLLQVPLAPKIETPQEQEAPYVEKPYSALSYMLPRYWMPFGSTLDGGILLQASTGATDPVNQHSYNLGVEWDSLTKQTGGTFIYANTTTPIAITATASQVYRYIYSTQSTLQDTSGSINGSYDLPFLFSGWDFNLGWRHSNTEFTNKVIERSGPVASLGYSSVVQRGYEISPESGSAFQLSNQAYIESLGNIGYNKTNMSWSYYFSKWLPKRTVLATQLNGTYSPELKAFELFTTTLNGSFASNQLIAPFLARGYPSGNILGNNMLVANLEYRFPIAYIYKGVGTFPLYIKTIHGAVIGDAVGLDGFRWSQSNDGFLRERFGNNWFLGYGLEMHVETTIGYYLPVKFSFGAFRGDNRDVTSEDMSYYFAFIF